MNMLYCLFVGLVVVWLKIRWVAETTSRESSRQAKAMTVTPNNMLVDEAVVGGGVGRTQTIQIELLDSVDGLANKFWGAGRRAGGWEQGASLTAGAAEATEKTLHSLHSNNVVEDTRREDAEGVARVSDVEMEGVLESGGRVDNESEIHGARNISVCRVGLQSFTADAKNACSSA